MKHIRAFLSVALCLVALTGLGQTTGSTLTFPSSGRAATEAWVQEYLFDQLEKYVKADCDLTVSQISKETNAFQFRVAVSLPSVTQYTVKIQKGDQKWFWYNLQGPVIRIQNVPPLDSLRVTIRPTQFPSCYVSFRLDGKTDTTPDPDPDPNPNPSPTPCTNPPAIPVITNVTTKGFRATVSATGITQINWYVYNTANPNVNLRSGNRAFATQMDFAWSEELPSGSYGFRMEGVNCTASTSRTFTISTSAPPTGNCTAGPTILSVYNVSTTGLATQFHGNNVTLVKYIIKDNTGAPVRTGEIAPTSAVLNINFSSNLPVGNYILRLEAVNCNGFSEKDFTLSGSGGGTDPPQEPTGTIVAKRVTTGFPEHISISISGTGVNKKITDNANFTPPPGYEFRYYINNQLVKRNTRLVDFPWPSNVPVTIYKFQIRPDVGNLINWGYDEAWKDPNAGQPFSYNSSIAYAMFVFDDVNSGFSGDKQTVQWMDYLPDAPATDDKIWVANIGKINSPSQLMAKGVTNFSNYEIDRLSSAEKTSLINGGRTYDEAVKTPQQLSLPDRGAGQWVPPGLSYVYQWNTQFFDYTPGQTIPLTDQQGAEKGNQYSTAHRIVVFENSENVHYIGTHWSFWRPYYQNLTARYQQRFPGKWRVIHNYFTGAVGRYSPNDSKAFQYGETPGALFYSTRGQAKAFLSASTTDWPQSNLMPGQNMETVNSAAYPIYLNSPDEYAQQAYNFIYNSYLTHKIGKYLYIFAQNFVEWFPNNLFEVRYPEGKFYFKDKIPHGFVDIFNYAFLSRTFGDGFIPFGGGKKTDENWRFSRTYHGDGLWIPNGSTTPQNNNSFPFWVGDNAYQYPSNGFDDAIGRGMYLYSQTFMQTTGGTGQFLRYRLDGGNWVNPQNNNPMYDIVDGHFDKRGIVWAQVKNGKMAVMYLNPYATGENHTVEYEYNGTTYSMPVASTMVHAKIHNL